VRLASLVVAALLLAGCGGGSTPAGGTAPARSLVLRAADLPADWSSAPHDAAADNYGRIAARYRRCIGSDVELPADAEQASSPDFAQANGARQVKSAVTLAGDTAGPAVRDLDRPRSATCLTDSFQAVLPADEVAGLEVRSVSTAPLPMTADVDEVVALRTTLGLRLHAADFVVYVDNVFLADGPWFGRLYFVGTVQPLDAALERRLVADVAGRMSSAR
jgi:hypothetical protein